MRLLRLVPGLVIAVASTRALPNQTSSAMPTASVATANASKRSTDHVVISTAPAAVPSTSPAPAPDISDHVIHQAVKDSIDPRDDPPSSPATFGGGPTDRQAHIDRAFAAAEIPSCMTMDAWKFAPPMIGPIPIPGFFAAPLLLRNIVTGKCRH